MRDKDRVKFVCGYVLRKYLDSYFVGILRVIFLCIMKLIFDFFGYRIFM